MTEYAVGDVGQSGGKLHLFTVDEDGGVRLETVCSVEKQVKNLLRSQVDEDTEPLEYLQSFYGDRLCVNCVRRAEEAG